MQGARFLLSAAQTKAILERLQSCGQATDIFERHFTPNSIVGDPLTTGDRVKLLEDGPAT